MFQNVEKIWWPGSLSGDIKSHPERALSSHLEGTNKLMNTLLQEHGLKGMISHDEIQLVSLTHDLGKADPLFQDYLNGKGQGTNHSLPSAWFTFHYVDSKSDMSLPIIWMLETVRRHHTNIENAEKSLNFWQIQTPEIFSSQTEKIRKLIPSWKPLRSQDEWQEFAEELFLYSKKMIDQDNWLKFRMLYSLLITADRMDAIGIRTLGTRTIPTFIPPDFSRQKASFVNDWRKKIHSLCMNSLKDIDKPGLYSLTLPTGSGKTITGLDIARTLASKFNSRAIIYALPFISIIEQNSSVAKKLFGNGNVQEDHSQKDYRTEGDDYKSPWFRLRNLFRYWHSPVVLTTMVQLWDAIYSPRANDSMDFHRLSNAIVIMDEPQTIEPRYWEGFGNTLKFISQKMETTFILMTATQPHIINDTELAPRNVTFPYDRHKYIILPGKYEIEELPELLNENIEEDVLRSGLLVFNTRSSALKAYRQLKDLLNGPVLFLSTWMIPRHRKKIMACLKYFAKRKIRHYLVATQVVEAGVDLDFNWVFRDMGPLDSIVQVAGRCNRHKHNVDIGKVLVAELSNEKGKPYCSQVYDDILLDSSRRSLKLEKDVNVFEESRIAPKVDAYYEVITEKLQSAPIWENICNGKWGPDSKYPLIKDKSFFNTERVYIEYDYKLRPILERLANTKWTLSNMEEKKMLTTKADQYIIEIPAKYIASWKENLINRNFDDELPPVHYSKQFRNWFITKEGTKHLYDRITGFIPPEMDDFKDERDCFL